MNKGFRLILSLVLVVALVCGATCACAEGILPVIPKVYETELPSVGEALGRYPDSETQQEDGSVTEFYSGISEEDYQTFSVYLGEQGATLGSYELEGVVLTAEIQAEETSFQLVYDSGAGEIRATYPAGTRAKKAKISVQAGGTLEFGHYPQTAEGTDGTPIEWIVLEVDEENHRALLLSKYGLDAKPYNTQRKDIHWETCSLRMWMNNDFMNMAFTTEEQSAILLTDVDNSSAQGYHGWWNEYGENITQDHIFLLSYAEANRYFEVEHANDPDSENMASRVAPTAYAIKQGAYASSSMKTADGDAAGAWWLRLPHHQHAGVVHTDGSLVGDWISDNDNCVRPALWISLE